MPFHSGSVHVNAQDTGPSADGTARRHMSSRNANAAPNVGFRMGNDRHLEWDQLYNARDLGGLPVAGGGTVRRRAVVRGDAPERLTATGWDQLWQYGIRTVIDLRDDGEPEPDSSPRPPGLTTVHLPWSSPGIPGSGAAGRPVPTARRCTTPHSCSASPVGSAG